MTTQLTASSAITAPTRHLQVGPTRFAYRRVGEPTTDRPAVVCVNHFLGNLETFDPAITDALGHNREVVLFDNAGVGLSTGTAPDTVEGMAEDAAGFIAALDLGLVDLIGHSMGGEVSQMILAHHPELVRRAVLVGTGPRAGEGMASQRPETAELFAQRPDLHDEVWLPIMFPPSEAAQAAGREWLQRTRARQQDRDLRVSDETRTAHRTAAGRWGAPTNHAWDYLHSITHPVLVVNGSDDIVIATVNSFILQQHLSSGELVLYPDSGHGAHFQYPKRFVEHVQSFLARD